MLNELIARVEQWISADPEPADQEELRELVAAAQRENSAAMAELLNRFATSLQFGTAGLRGAMAAGPNRMNRAVVIRAAAGLCAFLKQALPGQTPKLVIGFDARHNSAQFALDTAAVATAAGVQAVLSPRFLPTPLLAFAVRHLNADAGVQVTASHNPAADNGYKVYLGGRVVTDSGQGAQIVPPYDTQIAAAIAAAPVANQVPRADSGWALLPETLWDDYVSSVVDSVGSAPGPLRIVHTAMHGVGTAVSDRLFEAAGYTDVHRVGAQAQPDPDFPTVAFPNPEEPGAIDLALAEARRVGADLVIAHDPDADRCAIAVADPHRDGDGWRMLHGDEIGAILGAAGAKSAVDAGNRDAVLANSVVSSRLLGRIAAAAGLNHRVTVTGFKWIGRVPGEVYGYEEAIGYCVAPQLVRDKDGLSAGLSVAKLAAELKAQGRGLIDLLDDLARQHGLYLTNQLSGRFADLSRIPATMATLRQTPPQTLAGSPVVSVRDLSEGSSELPPTDGLEFLTADDSRVVVRPSGTEPKVKCYLEVIIPVAPDADFDAVGAARTQAAAKLAAIRTDMASAMGIQP
jgi:phosphomannomutase